MTFQCLRSSPRRPARTGFLPNVQTCHKGSQSRQSRGGGGTDTARCFPSPTDAQNGEREYSCNFQLILLCHALHCMLAAPSGGAAISRAPCRSEDDVTIVRFLWPWCQRQFFPSSFLFRMSQSCVQFKCMGKGRREGGRKLGSARPLFTPPLY